VIVGNLWEGDLLIALTSLLVVLVLVLAQLATAISAKTVEVSRVRQCHRVSFTAGNRDDFLVAQSLDPCWVRLVWLIFGVLG